MNRNLKFILVFALLSLQSCFWYSFKGISIPPEILTFNVDNFTNRAYNTPIDIETLFAEELRSKIRNESRLKLNNANPDITFAGDITGFSVTTEAPKQGATVALDKLTITVKIDYVDNTNEENNWNKNFSFFETYDNSQSLQDIQDQLTLNIFKQLTENIFNESFTDW